MPGIYLKTIINMEASVVAATAKEKEKKKMNKTVAQALNGMKQKVKKAQKEFETALKSYQEVGLPFISLCDS